MQKDNDTLETIYEILQRTLLEILFADGQLLLAPKREAASTFSVFSLVVDFQERACTKMNLVSNFFND